ncbi:MAG: VWA domain-containing protein [Lachnospiraceae bacterium]|nr:VWA domain-containing protein [Lachnospiraceae bacterium]
MNNFKKSNVIIFIIPTLLFILIAILLIRVATGGSSGKTGKTVEKLMEDIEVNTATPTKGKVNLAANNLYDELPEITKYPLAVQGSGAVDIEIFTSGEKAGKGDDSWLIDVANSFNGENKTLTTGETVSMSVRSIPSGTAADYIISNKYLPDLYTPSNTLFGEYAKVNGGDLEMYDTRLVGNTAGILVKKGAYKDFDSVIKAVQAGQINMGYTNPQTSATGINLLLTLLKDGEDNFINFNKNIPYVAFTTQQMRDSASSGKLDAMLTEYQAYINDKNLTSMYDFIPFGMRHDNPVYICGKGVKTPAELEAITTVIDYCKNANMQKIATDKGFNANEDYKSDLDFSGAEVTNGLEVYKQKKDNGEDIIAVFVADCSGSMSGEPLLQLKNSLTNGMSYINDNNYVGLVSYSSDVTVELPIAQLDLNQRAFFQGAIDNLVANGSTATYDAITVAIDMINKAKVDHPTAKCMIILLSDGAQNEGYSLSTITYALTESRIPVYTIGYGADADADELARVSTINEAATIKADEEDIIYKLKSLFNSQL